MTLSMDRWVGKIAVVTGASSGIGAAISEFLIDKGIMVVGLARRVELLEEKVQQLSDKPGRFFPFKADMRNEEDIVEAFQWIERELGHVHILVNCAGVSASGSLWDGDGESWKKVLEVNVFGLCIATREAVKIMKEYEINGQIIHINSIAGHRIPILPELNVYGGSKHAVTALAETLRREFIDLGCKIRITNLSPGFVATEMTTLNPTITEERLEIFNSMPMLRPEDIADAVGYILSTPESVQINQLTITPVGELV